MIVYVYPVLSGYFFYFTPASSFLFHLEAPVSVSCRIRFIEATHYVRYRYGFFNILEMSSC
jgi:hypothetical protein